MIVEREHSITTATKFYINSIKYSLFLSLSIKIFYTRKSKVIIILYNLYNNNNNNNNIIIIIKLSFL